MDGIKGEGVGVGVNEIEWNGWRGRGRERVEGGGEGGFAVDIPLIVASHRTTPHRTSSYRMARLSIPLQSVCENAE